MDADLLSRIQFALTASFHFIYPPLSMGLGLMMVVIGIIYVRTKDPKWREMSFFWVKVYGLIFALGVATGVVQEFEFGTNWAEYSRFVGNVFGSLLAAEGVFAFFLESTFLGVYLFARQRLSKGWHWFSILMVALGSTLSAFWIIVANSWMQTPAGHTVNAATGRAELTDFWAAVFNPSTTIRYLHTVSAALVCGAFFMAGVASYVLLKRGRQTTLPASDPAPMAKRALKASLIFGLLASLLTAYPTGHHHAKQVAHTQPEKFAAIEGLYTSRTRAPLVMFALPFTPPPELKASIEVPGILSWMAFGDVDAHVPGIDKFPKDEIPPLWLTFVSFHNMVLLGMLFIASTALGLWRLRGGKLYTGRWFLWILLIISPLPLAACQFGWVTAEVGRQPWIVYHVMKTADAFSSNLTPAHVWFSLILFTAIYIVLLVMYLFLLLRQLHKSLAPQAPAV